MASTYSTEFTFKIGALKVLMRETPDDGIRQAITNAIDGIASKFNLTLTSATANSAAGGGDLAYGTVLSIAGSGTTTLDLRSLTDLANRATQAFGRYKFLLFALLSTAQGGTACSSVTVGNAASNAHQLFLGGDTMTFTLENGDAILNVKTSAAGKVVDGTNKSVLITNNDAGVAAEVLVIIVGGDD